MLFPTFFENNYFAGGGGVVKKTSFHVCRVNLGYRYESPGREGRLVLASNLLAGDLSQPSYTSTYVSIYIHNKCIQ